jgi:uncharacterized phage protein (TIGR01671 family)
MREYKFRGKYVERDKWVYGYYVKGIQEDEAYILKNHNGDWSWSDVWFAVYPETVGQFTGLKDKNGKEIYEGDIIILPDEDDDEYFVIEWDDDTARFAIVQHGSTMCDFDNYYGKELCIIGNIYENPELLKENVQPMQRLVPAGAAGEAGRRLYHEPL